MSDGEHIDLELSGRKLRGTMHWPQRGGDTPLPAALLCPSPDGLASEAVLIAQLARALADAGVATAVSHAGADRSNAGGDPTLWTHAVDDAAAIFRWVALHDRIDLTRLCVIGYGRGAIVASCLARRSDQIAGLCLIAPSATPATTGGGEEVLNNGDGALRPVQDAAHFERPTFILIAGGDEVVSVPDTRAYLNALENVERRVQHLIIARADHGFSDDALRHLCVTQAVHFVRDVPVLEHTESNL